MCGRAFITKPESFVTRKRHRKSINPFRIRLQVQRPDWSSILDLSKPIEVDLGFGRGEFIVEMARRRPDAQFVGIEIRQYLIEKMRKRLQEGPISILKGCAMA